MLSSLSTRLSPSIHRRAALKLLSGSACAAVCATAFGGRAEPPAKTGLGLVIYCCRFRRQALLRERPEHDLYDPLNFLEHCRQLGAGGMQVNLGVRDQAYTAQLRRRAERHELFVEAIVGLPKEAGDVERFEAELKTASAAGAAAARTVIIPGRRYETFDSLAQFRQAEARGRRSLERAAPLAEKLRLPLAVENHKDHRADERVALFEHISSRYVGACVDTGNSFALLEDPLDTAAALAPWAHSVHLKDQAVQLYDDGFLLGDIPLGQGFIDLPRVVEVLRGQKPDIRFSLELITRDPLRVPVLTQKYWATFPDLPARELARTLRTVHERAAAELQQVATLPPDEQTALEDANVRASLDYARDRLRL